MVLLIVDAHHCFEIKILQLVSSVNVFHQVMDVQIETCVKLFFELYQPTAR